MSKAKAKAKANAKVSAVVGDEIKRKVLDQLVLAPRLKAAARTVGVHPTSLFRWLKKFSGRAGKTHPAMARQVRAIFPARQCCQKIEHHCPEIMPPVILRSTATPARNSTTASRCGKSRRRSPPTPLSLMKCPGSSDTARGRETTISSGTKMAHSSRSWMSVRRTRPSWSSC